MAMAPAANEEVDGKGEAEHLLTRGLCCSLLSATGSSLDGGFTGTRGFRGGFGGFGGGGAHALASDGREAAAEFALDPLLADLSNNRPLRLFLPGVFNELPVPPYVVGEWRDVQTQPLS